MMKKVQLNNNQEMDVLGLGTYEMKVENVDGAVKAAMKTGYRLYDTAQVYKNEAEVSAAIAATGISRNEIFLTTKIATTNQGYDAAKASVLDSLAKMKQEYLDLVLIHWPGAKGVDLQSPQNKDLRHGSFRALVELQKAGKVKNIGVSNFMASHLRGILETFDEKPQVNQIEFSPICYPAKDIAYAQENKVAVQAYSTLGRGQLLSSEWINQYPILQQLQKKGSIAQYLLKWVIDKDCLVIPKSITPQRIQENFDALSVTLTEEETQALDNFPISHRTCWDPNTIL
ncbi:hypothetical protein NEHOM01_0908 [Nematocida homosporus]|uniref:uncharacterized protein n=1 Tax=Nematocida homosporus TaxID=1912981 RepID=UPI00221E5D33|nr:uncharacterized protein NEHOM01_0908 [Nematocida homosporus]KAI5185549.1 hypothetical protein NEHOM01_0908 [Nematocida homosporus]